MQVNYTTSNMLNSYIKLLGKLEVKMINKKNIVKLVGMAALAIAVLFGNVNVKSASATILK